MKLFVFCFSDRAKLTDNYHGGGSVVLLANSKEEAEAGVRNSYIQLDWGELLSVKEHELDAVLSFQDAGCC